MKNQQNIQRRFFLTFHFEQFFMPDTTSGKKQYVINFLDDLSKKACDKNVYLQAMYSIVKDSYGCHVHLITNWLPTVSRKTVFSKKPRALIDRYDVLEMLNKNYFTVSNKKKGIKRITKTPNNTEWYIKNQPSKNQTVILHQTYFAKKPETIHSDTVQKSYYRACRNCKFPIQSNRALITHQQKGCMDLIMISILSLLTIFMISGLLQQLL